MRSVRARSLYRVLWSSLFFAVDNIRTFTYVITAIYQPTNNLWAQDSQPGDNAYGPNPKGL